MIPRVNYLIAAAAHRVKYPYGKDILRLHLEELGKTNTEDLSQVTVLRTLPLERDQRYSAETKHYWDIDASIKNIKCPVVTLDVTDMYFSYSSWVQACQHYLEDFDYYVLIEDDYYPSKEDFVKILIDLHKKKLPNGGYLNSFTAYGHAAVSNGLVDSKTFCEGIRKYTIEEVLSQGAQMYFGKFFDNKLADYVDQYRTLFSSSQTNETHDPSLDLKIDIFRPIEYLIFGEKVTHTNIEK